jgi:sec-independent protein translocase protein TatA
MEGFGIDKLILILVIVLVLFGARRIPEIGGSIGKGIREFKRGMKDIDRDDTEPLASRTATPPLSTPEKSEMMNAEPKRLLDQ